ncbi:MAG: hypothetical protein H7143_00890 [Pseudorhodobacter sp.]|nr:hypothetical protein [Rhizobacter sp.]
MESKGAVFVIATTRRLSRFFARQRREPVSSTSVTAVDLDQFNLAEVKDDEA